MTAVINFLVNMRDNLALHISRSILNHDFSILSDDCWGGQIYKQLEIPYLTPTVGLWIRESDFIDYVTNFDSLHHNKILFKNTERQYPVGMMSNIEINFMHFSTEHHAETRYIKRLNRLNKERLFVKIDFGKPGYTIEDIKRWNKLKIERSVAFYPPHIEIPTEGVHNGVLVPDWDFNGAKMFDITRKHFNVFAWIKTGSVECSKIYKILNGVLFDPTAPRRFTNKIAQLFKN